MTHTLAKGRDRNGGPGPGTCDALASLHRMPVALEVVAAILGAIAAALAIGKWLIPRIRKAWGSHKGAETLAIVQMPHTAKWTPNLYGRSDTGEARGQWHFTNLTEYPMQVLAARLLKRPGAEANVQLAGYMDEEETIPIGSIGPHQTESALVIFHVRPQPRVPEGEAYVSDVEFVDSHGRRHRVRRVRFVHRPGRRKK